MKTRIGDFNNYGTEETTDGMMFTFSVCGEGDCAIELYTTTDFRLVDSVTISQEYRIGDVYSVVLIGQNFKRNCYLIAQEKQRFVDPYAASIIGRNRWSDAGREKHGYRVYGGMSCGGYEWKHPSPSIAPANMVMYKLHMRGFTMNHGLQAGKKGNYKGLLEKLDYLKALGITSIELQPIYEFEEIFYEDRQVIGPRGEIKKERYPMEKTNYWGYGAAYYMAPKASYFGGKDVIQHCKEMIDTIHGAGMEVIMEVSFDEKVSNDYMMDCLWYWVKEYRVDGFHLLGCNIPMERIAKSHRLAHTKIFHDNISNEILAMEKGRKHLFLYDDSFMYVCRQIQNHMQGSMVQFTNYLRRQNKHYGFVNYAANTNGFTLWDSYTYGEKHNDANGEGNKDGNNINYSFNNGIEGETKNRQIQQMRMLQMRNGLSATFLSQAIPLLRAGDEFANSQEGNNNPYCQDNAIGWTQFARTKGRQQLMEFTQKLIAFRKEHKVLRSEDAMHMTDYRHIGAPDISYHGYEPWLMGIGEEMKAVGIFYMGAYEGKGADNVYVIYNYHYDEVQIALPNTSDTRKWSLVMNTATEETLSFEPRLLENQHMIAVPGGSISILTS